MSFVVSSFRAAAGSLRSVPSASVQIRAVVWVAGGRRVSLSEARSMVSLHGFECLTCVAVCSDDRSRKFRCGNTSEEDARRLCGLVTAACASGEMVRFVAAGSNSPDVWFCGLV